MIELHRFQASDRHCLVDDEGFAELRRMFGDRAERIVADNPLVRMLDGCPVFINGCPCDGGR